MQCLSNLILNTDSYKASHWLQYPPGTDATFFYVESRGGLYDRTLFYGLQSILKEYLAKPITHADVDEARDVFAAHGEPFNEAGWRYIIDRHGGHMPIRIRAVPEGTVVPTHQALVTIESTDPDAYWVPSYLETMLLRLWYPVTVATISWHAKQTIRQFLERTSDDPVGQLPFKLHDFGARGVSSAESAALGRCGAPRQLHGDRQRVGPAGGARVLPRADGRFLDSRGRAQHDHQLGPRERSRGLPQHAAAVREAGCRRRGGLRQL